MAWMPGASRVQTYRGNRHKATIDKLVVHTTEGSSWPGYANGGNAPHFTTKRTGSIRQHIDTAFSAKALVNRRGGVETNNDGVLQVENIGSCDRAYARRHGLFFWPDATDDDLLPLARIMAWAHEEHGLPLTTRSLIWSDTDAAYATAPQRMTFQEWRDFTGVCGHQHVPENDHWDPGKMPVTRAVELARELVGATADVPAADPSRPWRTSPRVSDFSDTEVRRLQVALRDAGYDLGSYGVDGSYGDATGRAVLQFQTDVGLTADGIYGPSTEEAMTKLDDISKDLATIKRTLEPGVSGKRTDGELVAALRGFRNDIPAMVLDEPIKLAGMHKGQTSTLRTKAAYEAHNFTQTHRQIAALQGELAGLEHALQAIDAGDPLDLDQVRAAARDGVSQALDSLEVTVTREG